MKGAGEGGGPTLQEILRYQIKSQTKTHFHNYTLFLCSSITQKLVPLKRNRASISL